ncbi:hypothetical protein BC834DRAFT_81197 [Gloeopeniophorella convolvens]|nr:hypothetical protein BC834DRAFT_81197 [Gloeopeniophorella convolvens]
MSSFYPPPPSSPFAGARAQAGGRQDYYQGRPYDSFNSPQPSSPNQQRAPTPSEPQTGFSATLSLGGQPFGGQPVPQPYSSPYGKVTSERTSTTSVSQTTEVSVTTTVTVKTYKTVLQWKADAQAATAEYQRSGFPSPLAWVYVEGHNIPPGAVIGGVDRKGPWHIARAFYEGSMELGKAGRHLRLGATVSFNGKDRDVDAYEILVEANTPTRWIYQPPAPRPAPPAPKVSDFKLVVIVDDSDSMEGHLWAEARDALAGVAEVSRFNGGDGLDLYCLNSPSYELDVRSETDVHAFFDTIVPDGQTPLGAKLHEVLGYYAPKVEDPSLQHKPISILVITDGVPTDDPRSVIVEFARRLDARNVPLRQLGIQFVQIGDDQAASEALKELDDQLGPQHGVRDMVDTTTFSPNEPHLRTESIIKILLGAIDHELDNRNAPAFPQRR